MTEQTYTHRDLAEFLGVSETTVKSYRRKFPGCIPVASRGKPIRFTHQAASVAARIRDLFETGMGVEDVRRRLADEFDWISPESPARDGGGGEGIGPGLSHGVSSMAKSLVALTQQQKAVADRIRGIEAALEEAGVKAPESGESARGRTRARAQAIEERLDRLDANAEALSQSVQALAGQLARFLGQRAEAAESWQQEGAAVLASASRLASEAAARPEQARVIPLRQRQNGNGLQQPAQMPAEGQAAEPERVFFSLPLVVRTEEGRYVSAGGRNRGRFSLNDLKAMLIYGFTPPDHFSLHWERHGQGWWLTLEQENGGRSIQLLLMELPTQKGGSVAEILQLKEDGDTLHPAQIRLIIDSFGESR